MSYVSEVIAAVEAKHPHETEFLQTVKEVLTSIEPAVNANEELYRKNAILERMVEPDRQVTFRVAWVDDNGKPQVNTGYRVQFNNA
ncbi:MAG: glutamate dehydrogenase, partial [Bacteroidales bacterium]|nr:glutamate dehydrogenase [Bacteroidales bacterium]